MNDVLQIAAKSDELKKLIAEHPDYDIVVLVETELADDRYAYVYAPSLHFGVCEILDCDNRINEEYVYNDRDQFEDDLRDYLDGFEEYASLSNAEFDEVVKEKLKEYDPYWRNVIVITADV